MKFITLDYFFSHFTTSADAVMKASGLRLEAIRAIAREQGVEIGNVHRRCIDENLLEELAKAHVRRLKSYFNNSRRHISELSGADLRAFVNFCIIFKKHHLSHAAETWDDIDTNAIREQFFKKVKYSTSAQSSNDSRSFSILEYVAVKRMRTSFGRMPNEGQHNPGVSILFSNIYHGVYFHSFSHENDDDTYDFLRKEEVIRNVIHSRWYYDRPVRKRIIHTDQRDIVRRVTLSARYHIFSDDDEHLCDTRIFRTNSYVHRIVA
jgi:hypothetical protein